MTRIDANYSGKTSWRPFGFYSRHSRDSRARFRLLFAAIALFLCFAGSAAEKKIVLIAGKPSHGPGEHEFRAGSLLLNKCLNQVPGITSVVHSNGWPQNADAV